MLNRARGPPLPWSYGSWIYNYLCNQCLSPLMLWVRISIREKCTTLCDKVCQWHVTSLWFSPGSPVSSTNKTDCQDITEILLNVALNTIMQTNKLNQANHAYLILFLYLSCVIKLYVIHPLILYYNFKFISSLKW
jgi:hypothetical protein